MKILDAKWISARTCIGVVFVDNDMCRRSARIAAVPGINEEADKLFIADYGAKLDIAVAMAFFPSLITIENFKHK